MKGYIFLAVLVVGAFFARGAIAGENATAMAALNAGLFYPNITGAPNPNVTDANIASTVCKSGWTATVRPPDAVTEKEKKAAMAKVGIPWSQSKSYEWDHRVPIEGAGSPTSLDNLSLQSYVAKPWNAHVKDKLENFAKRQICSHKWTVAQAQAVFIRTDWRVEYCKYFTDMRAACAALKP